MIDARLLRDSLEAVLAKDDDFPKRFYDILFEKHPEVKPLFHRSSPGAQRKMFAQKLTAIVDHVEEAEWIERELAAVRQSHDGYGVTPGMYAVVGDVLIQTLREGLGPEFTPEVERTWREAYGAISAVILK